MGYAYLTQSPYSHLHYTSSFGVKVNYGKNWSVNTLFESRFGDYGVTNLTDAFRKSHSLIGRNTPDAADNESRLINPANAGQGRLDAANEWVRTHLALSPYSGLNTIEEFEELPGFPITSVEGHKSQLILGQINGVDIAVLQGRVHW